MTANTPAQATALPPAKASDAEKVEAMCALIVAGMTKTKAMVEVFGDGRKFWEVVSKSGDFQFQVAQALEVYADRLVDEALEIADTDKDANRARNRVSVRQWHAGKLRPKVYGERLELAVQHSISISEALSEARARANVNRPQEVQDAEIVGPSDLPVLDIQPTPALVPDIFS